MDIFFVHFEKNFFRFENFVKKTRVTIMLSFHKIFKILCEHKFFEGFYFWIFKNEFFKKWKQMETKKFEKRSKRSGIFSL